MFSGAGVTNADGTEWYFPQRLSDDLGRGRQRDAQPRAAGARAQGRGWAESCPHSLRIYAFGAALGGRLILDEAAALARQSHIPRRQVTLVDRHATYAHNDPNGAYPHNAFADRLVPFLDGIAHQRG